MKIFGQEASFLLQEDISELEKVLLKDGQLQPVPYSAIVQFPQSQISLFCWKHAIYQIVTNELVDFIKNEIGSDKAIEVGGGNGCLGRSLSIPITDSCQQEFPYYEQYYKLANNPPIVYPKDIIPYAADVAIGLFKPDVVVGAWVTEIWDEVKQKDNSMGIDEVAFKGKVKKYIVVGNESIHGDKRIMGMFPYRTIKAEWLVSRTMKREQNIIYIFDCQ